MHARFMLEGLDLISDPEDSVRKPLFEAGIVAELLKQFGVVGKQVHHNPLITALGHGHGAFPHQQLQFNSCLPVSMEIPLKAPGCAVDVWQRAALS